MQLAAMERMRPSSIDVLRDPRMGTVSRGKGIDGVFGVEDAAAVVVGVRGVKPPTVVRRKGTMPGRRCGGRTRGGT